MQTITTNFKRLFVAILLSLAFAQAQQAGELAKHPEQTIKLDVKFHGPDAAKFNAVYPSLDMHEQPIPSQKGFLSGFPGNCTNVPPEAFTCKFTIPKQIATGDYFLTLDSRGDGIQIQYQSGQDFQFHTIRIEDSKTFTIPSVTVTEQH